MLSIIYNGSQSKQSELRGRTITFSSNIQSVDEVSTFSDESARTGEERIRSELEQSEMEQTEIESKQPAVLPEEVPIEPELPEVPPIEPEPPEAVPTEPEPPEVPIVPEPPEAVPSEGEPMAE